MFSADGDFNFCVRSSPLRGYCGDQKVPKVIIVGESLDSQDCGDPKVPKVITVGERLDSQD